MQDSNQDPPLEGIWDKVTHASLNVLFSSSRSKRISIGLKQTVCAHVKATKTLKRPHAWFEAKDSIEKTSVQSDGQAPDTTKKPKLSRAASSLFLIDKQLQYLGAGRRDFHSTKHVNLVMDAVRASGEDLLYIILYAVAEKRGMWLPPQARVLLLPLLLPRPNLKQ